MAELATRGRILAEIVLERDRQDAKWGQQDHPDGTDPTRFTLADEAKVLTDRAAREGHLTWRLILDEEMAEAGAETDLDALRTELIQIGAVAVAWIEAIDRRRKNG